MSLSKYFGESSDANGAPLFWPGVDEYPFRGSNVPPMLKKDEIEQIPLVLDAKAEVLTLPKDIKRYEEIIDRCANGWYSMRFEKTNYDAEKREYIVFLSWVEVYGELPNSKSAWEAIKHAN